MPIIVRPLEIHEIPKFMSLNLEAFQVTNKFAQLMTPKGFGPARLQFHQDMVKKDVTTTKPNVFVLCAKDEDSDDIIAGAKWKVEDLTSDAEKDDEPEEEQPTDPDFPWNKEVEDLFKAQNKESCAEIMAGQRFWHLRVLFANQAHGRRGGGTKCLQWGIERADAQGLACYLDSTAMGRPLYERLGFEVRKTDEIDMRKWGVDATNLSFAMVRPPRAKTDVQGAMAVLAEAEKTVH